MDANYNYFPLEDPEHVFSNPNAAFALETTQDGNTLFIYTSDQSGGYIYSWDSVNYYKFLYNNTYLLPDMTVDASNNLYSMTLIITFSHHAVSSSYDLIVLSASNGYQGKLINTSHLPFYSK